MKDVTTLLIKESIAEWLRDGSEKHGEGFVLLALCRTCLCRQSGLQRTARTMVDK
jgi:hypothetical protein